MEERVPADLTLCSPDHTVRSRGLRLQVLENVERFLHTECPPPPAPRCGVLGGLSSEKGQPETPEEQETGAATSLPASPCWSPAYTVTMT